MKHSFWCLDIKWNTPPRVWYISSRCLDIRWNTPPRVWYISSRCLDIRSNTPSRVWYITSRCLDTRWNTPPCGWYISYRCLDIRWHAPRVWCIILIGVWISDEAVRLVFDIILHLGVFKHRMKHCISYWACYFSMFGYQMKCSFSRWYITSRCSDIGRNTVSPVWCITWPFTGLRTVPSVIHGTLTSSGVLRTYRCTLRGKTSSSWFFRVKVVTVLVSLTFFV